MKDNFFKGFSLIELLVVIFILGVLASIAIPNFTKMKDNSKVVEAKTGLASLSRAQQTYFLEHGDYQEDMDTIEFNFEPKSYLIGFGKSIDPMNNSVLYRGPDDQIQTPLSANCSLTNTGFKAGSSNQNNKIQNFTINQRGCLRQIQTGNNCSQPLEPKECL